MPARIARWAFVAVYAIIAVIALWGGWLQLNPVAPPPPPNAGPNFIALAPEVNSETIVTAAFYFLTAIGFGAVAALATLRTLKNDARALTFGLNLAYAALLAVIGAYLVWKGGELVSLGGSFYYPLMGLMLLGVAFLLYTRNTLSATIYAAILVITVVWSIFEAGLDFIALLPRLAAWLVVGLWFLTPWHKMAMQSSPEVAVNTGGRWVGFASLAGFLLLVLAGLQGYPVVEGTKNAAVTTPAVTDWRFYGGVAQGQRFAQIDQINLKNVSQLKEAWRYRTNVAYDFKDTPQEANGLVYVCTAGNTLIALDSDTGKEVWKYDTKNKVPGARNGDMSSASTFARTCRGLGYHEAPADYKGECPKRIITATTDARLIAVDAMTGKPCTDFGFDGQVNLVSGLGRSPPGNYMVTSAPLVAKDVVVVGGWVTDNQQVGNPSGVIRAYNAMTGQFAWAWDMGNPGFHGLPDEGGEYTRGTPNAWSNMSYDPDLNLIYAPTGNSSPDYFDGQLRTKFAEEFASSVIAIDGATGEPKWHYQTVHRDIWDWDVPSQPVLVNVRKNGQGDPIPAVAQPTKRGEIFLLDRRDGTPIYPIEEKPVPQKPEQGETTAPTQPFSPLPNFRADRIEQDMWGMTPLDQLWCRVEFKKMRYDGHFTPPMRGGGGYGQEKASWGGSFQYPGNAGGFNWGSVSVDADNGLLVAAPMLMGNRITLASLDDRAEAAKHMADRRAKALAAKVGATPADQGGPAAPGNPEDQRRGQGGGGFGGGPDPRYDQKTVLYTANTSPFMSDWRLPLPWITGDDKQQLGTSLPCFEPPWGQIAVIDLNTNKLLWKRGFGSMKHAGPFGIESGLPFMVGTPLQAGSMTTRGGLIFHAGGMDNTIRAFDLRNGQVKWESDLPASAHATPMSYLGKNGKQYVVVTVPNPSWRYPRGGSDKPSDDQGGWVIAYALPDGAK